MNDIVCQPGYAQAQSLKTKMVAGVKTMKKNEVCTR
jgi:hypothetical protein